MMFQTTDFLNCLSHVICAVVRRNVPTSRSNSPRVPADILCIGLFTLILPVEFVTPGSSATLFCSSGLYKLAVSRTETDADYKVPVKNTLCENFIKFDNFDLWPRENVALLTTSFVRTSKIEVTWNCMG